LSDWKRKAEAWRARIAEKLPAEREPNRPRPRLCPACGSLVGSTSTRCYQCGSNVNFSLAATSRFMSRLLPATSPASYAILSLSCLLYAATVMATIHEGGMQELGGGLFSMGGISGNVLVKFGASLPFPYTLAQPWRLVMAIFLHGSLIHIGMNMWVLMDIGPTVEELYGSARFFFLYVVTGIAGFIASSATGHVSVGGSASLLGLIGVMLAVTITRGGAAMQMLRGQLIRWLIYIGIFGLIFHGVDNAAHLGGLAAGFLLGKIMVDRPPLAMEEHRRSLILGWAAVAVVAVSMFLMVWNALHVV
jgi:membrane associated rhomboid family serine protease